MRSSVEPLSAKPRDPSSSHDRPGASVVAAATSPAPHSGFMSHASLPKQETESQTNGSADQQLPRHTASTSSEENTGRASDDFSVGENNSDTITDPDVDVAERTFPKASSQPPQALGFQVLHQLATVAAQSDTHSNGSRSPHPLQQRPNESSIEIHDHNATSSQETNPKYQKIYDPAAPIIPVHGTHCCCRGVADIYLSILDNKEPADAAMLTKLYAECRDNLCPLHLDAYAKLITKAIEDLSISSSSPCYEFHAKGDAVEEMPWEIDFTVGKTGTGTRWVPGPRRRRRATSIPGIEEYEYELPPKRRRVVHAKRVTTRAVSASDTRPPIPQPVQCASRPTLDAGFNEAFRRKVLSELAQGFTDLKEDDWSRGETTNRYIHAILSKCKAPNTDLRKGPVEAGFLSGEEAAAVIEKGSERIPLFTEGQQQFQWTDNKRRPIAQLFHRMEDLTREVSVQIPSHNFDLPSYKTKSLEDIRDRFLAGHGSQDPWNILDLRSPLPPAILPKFLTGENCQLLPRIRDQLLEGHSGERTKATREEWNEWTELLEWVLMSEGGHNTAPHMDSHGWSTWITIQEGHFGFGWLARPTEKEQEAWMNDPLGYTGGKWRFVILKPGQTVFFPSGTVHFVFRLHEEQTLALGGHLLQWTALELWVQVILYQLKNPNITNEDLGTAPLKYVRTARKLVENRMATSRLGSMGGMSAAARFMVLSNVSYCFFVFCVLVYLLCTFSCLVVRIRANILNRRSKDGTTRRRRSGQGERPTNYFPSPPRLHFGARSSQSAMLFSSLQNFRTAYTGLGLLWTVRISMGQGRLDWRGSRQPGQKRWTTSTFSHVCPHGTKGVHCSGKWIVAKMGFTWRGLVG